MSTAQRLGSWYVVFVCGREVHAALNLGTAAPPLKQHLINGSVDNGAQQQHQQLAARSSSVFDAYLLEVAADVRRVAVERCLALQLLSGHRVAPVSCTAHVAC